MSELVNGEQAMPRIVLDLHYKPGRKKMHVFGGEILWFRHLEDFTSRQNFSVFQILILAILGH